MRRLAAIILVIATSPAYSAELTDLGEPAVIELAAAGASVNAAAGKTTLTLHKVDELASIAAAIHKRDARVFDAFPVRELPEAWNNCNAMKEEYHLFHKDGVNSMVIFDSGPASKNRPSYLAKAPLITAPKDRTRVPGDDEGIARVMLVNAVMASGDLTFDVINGAIEPGNYSNVRIMTECVID